MTAPRFSILIGYDDEANTYLANIVSITDNQARSVEAPSLKLLMTEISKSVRKREVLNRRFPMPVAEPSLIVRP